MHTSLVSDSVLRCDAFSLAADLDAYEVTCSRLLAQCHEMTLNSEVSASIARIRRYGVAVPPLTVLALQLVIAHCELEWTLWQKWSGRVSDKAFQEVKDRHAAAVRALRLGTRRLLVTND